MKNLLHPHKIYVSTIDKLCAISVRKIEILAEATRKIPKIQNHRKQVTSSTMVKVFIECEKNAN